VAVLAAAVLEAAQGLLVGAAGRGGEVGLGEERRNSLAERPGGGGEGDDPAGHRRLLGEVAGNVSGSAGYRARMDNEVRQLLSRGCGREWAVPRRDVYLPSTVTAMTNDATMSHHAHPWPTD
jgi:hypothetical protein